MVVFIPGSAFLWLLSIVTNVQGSSQRSKPIKKIYHVSDVEVSIQQQKHTSSHQLVQKINDDLCSQDSFLLHFSISSQEETQTSMQGKEKHFFSLYMKPIERHFIHPKAKMTNYGSNNSTDTITNKVVSTPILSDQVLAYSGFVVQSDLYPTKSLNQKDTFTAEQNDWANILVHHPYGKNCVKKNNLIFEGAFESSRRTWHIKSVHSYLRTKVPHDEDLFSSEANSDMVAWSDSEGPVIISQKEEYKEETRTNSTITKTITEYDIESEDRETGQQHYLQKRQTMASDIAGSTTQNVNYGNTIGSTEGCPNSLKMIYMGIAADCTYIRKYGSRDSVRLAVLNDMNIVSSLYQRTFNISLGIVEINFPSMDACPVQPQSDLPWNSDCPESPNGGLQIEQRLDQFSQWRSKKGSSDGAGLWHLMTDCPNGSEVGISWLGALCKVNAENGANGGTTSGTGVTAASPSEWQTMAHEIGHNLGAVHDCTPGCNEGDSCCPATKKSCSGGEQYLMAPSSSSGTTSSFSPCSIGNICSSLRAGNEQGVDTSCVTEPGQHYTISLNQCGNGILEAGEECDTGAIYSPCCQWGVCKFSPGAVCLPGPDSPCCSSTCQFAPPATPCNSSSPASQCTGGSALCPSN